MLIVHGKAAEVGQFADRLIGLKGVQHGRLVMTVPSVATASDGQGHSHEHAHKAGLKHSHNHKH